MASAGVVEVEDVGDGVARGRATLGQGTEGSLAEPGDVGELEGGHALEVEVVGVVGERRSDDLSIAAGVQLVVLVDTTVILAGLGGVADEHVAPGKGGDATGSTPLVDAVDLEDTTIVRGVITSDLGEERGTIFQNSVSYLSSEFQTAKTS